MTNQDAIYILSCLRKSLHEYCGLNDNAHKAFDMAISALQAQEAKNSKESSSTHIALDTISRQAAIELAMQYCPDDDGSCSKADRDIRELLDDLENLPSAQPTLYGYNMEHLKLIAEVLRKENLPPERVAEALTDIGKIVSIVRAECEEGFRKAVERCMI